MSNRTPDSTESPSADRMQGANGPTSDQDIDTAGTEADTLPGDTNSADIVGRTGEQMPQQSHDGVTSDDREVSQKRDDNPDTRRVAD